MHDLALLYEAAYVSAVRGNIDELRAFTGELVTTVSFAPPIRPEEVSEGAFKTTVRGIDAEVHFRLITKNSDDPLRAAVGPVFLGPPIPGRPPLRFDQLADHRGITPFVLVSVIFRARVADWLNATPHQSADPEFYEDLQVTGELPKEKDKILALRALNAVLKTNPYPKCKVKQFQYNDVTLFAETYFHKGSKAPSLIRAVALAASDALRKIAMREYFGGAYPQVREAIASFTLATPKISSENELCDAVLKFLEDVLRHHIEERRWVEAFWNDERYDTAGRRVPREPKQEPQIQPTLGVLFLEAFEHKGVRVSRETDEGTGSLDFCFSYNDGPNKLFKVNLEFKLAHHSRIKHGIERQLVHYLKANRSSHGIFLIFWFKDQAAIYFDRPDGTKDDLMNFVRQLAAETSTNNSVHITPVMIDASIRESASKN
jgi:hypothetical protein